MNIFVFRAQRIRDLLLVIVLLPLLLPLFIVLIICSLLFHRNHIFFTHKRVGLNGKEFSLIKFRSMVLNAQNQGSGLYSFIDDKRITPYGKFLRRTSLDELPQIINIIKGDMSFIGPRPAVVGELEEEPNLPKNTFLRLEVRPGITGWAQIHGRDNLIWPQKIKYDLQYLEFSPIKRLFIDLYILFYTPFYLLKFSATYEKRN